MFPQRNDRLRPPLPPSRLTREHPSFAAALLGAIYHSLDADTMSISLSERPPLPGRHRPSLTLSPSVSSVRSPRPRKSPRACRVLPDPRPLLPLPPPPEPTTDSAKKGNKKRDSAAFACLLSILLCKRRSSLEPAKPTARASLAGTAEPASARSILSSRASRRESAVGCVVAVVPARRVVRFSPVAVVVGEGHCHRGREAGMARLREAEMEAVVVAQDEPAAEVERRVEELLRALDVREEREKAKESVSESSSDLFELESLAAFDEAA